MPDFLDRFGQMTSGGQSFSNVRKGLIVGLVCLSPDDGSYFTWLTLFDFSSSRLEP